MTSAELNLLRAVECGVKALCYAMNSSLATQLCEQELHEMSEWVEAYFTQRQEESKKELCE